MLVLTRKAGERVCLGNEVVITVTRIDNAKVRLGIEAPAGIAIWREELTVGKDQESRVSGPGNHRERRRRTRQPAAPTDTHESEYLMPVGKIGG